MFLIGVISLISCTTTTKYKNIHDPVDGITQICFEYTSQELDQMTQGVGEKTLINMNKCQKQRDKKQCYTQQAQRTT